MKRKMFGLLLAVSAVALFVPAFADDKMGDGDGPTITVHGELRARWEYLDNFTDFQDKDSTTGAGDDSFDFTSYRARIGVDADFGS